MTHEKRRGPHLTLTTHDVAEKRRAVPERVLVAGAPRPLVHAVGLASPRGLVLGSDALHVLVHPRAPGSGQLVSIDRASGTVAVRARMGRPGELVADGRSLCWSEPDVGAIRRLEPGAEAVTVAVEQELPTHLVVGERGLAWVTRRNDVIRAGGARGELVRHFEAPVAGLAAAGDELIVALASGSLWRLARNGAAKRLLAGRGFERVVTDGRRVSWIDTVSDALCATDGGEVVELAPVTPGSADLIVAGDALVWCERRAIRRWRPDGRVETLAVQQAEPALLAAHQGSLAWVNRQDGALLTMPLGYEKFTF
jgi:hypothetical protein